MQAARGVEVYGVLVAIELSAKSWTLMIGDGSRQKRFVVGPEVAAVEQALREVKARWGLAESVRVRSCYEAGRDAFWIHRSLVGRGIENVVVDSSSIEVKRQARRVKTDRLDAQQLLDQLR